MLSANIQANNVKISTECHNQSHPVAPRGRCFYLGFSARQGYFTHFESSQSLGGAKMGDPREKPPDHMACLTCDPSEARTHSSAMTSDLER